MSTICKDCSQTLAEKDRNRLAILYQLEIEHTELGNLLNRIQDGTNAASELSDGLLHDLWDLTPIVKDYITAMAEYQHAVARSEMCSHSSER